MLEYGLEETENGVKSDYDLDGFAFGLGGNLSIISLKTQTMVSMQVFLLYRDWS